MRDTAIDPVTASSRRKARTARAPRPAPRPASHPAPYSSGVVAMMDRAVARVLRVQPRPFVPREAAATTGDRPFETSLLIAGVRCTVRYVELPLGLPFLGVATGAGFGILAILDLIAAVAIVATLRRLWRLQHPRRWQYLPVALALAVLIGVFFLIDARVLYV